MSDHLDEVTSRAADFAAAAHAPKSKKAPAHFMSQMRAHERRVAELEKRAGISRR